MEVPSISQRLLVRSPVTWGRGEYRANIRRRPLWILNILLIRIFSGKVFAHVNIFRWYFADMSNFRMLMITTMVLRMRNLVANLKAGGDDRWWSLSLVTMMMIMMTMMLVMLMVMTIMLYLAGDWKASPATGEGDNCQGSVVTGGPLQKYILIIRNVKRSLLRYLELYWFRQRWCLGWCCWLDICSDK